MLESATLLEADHLLPLLGVLLMPTSLRSSRLGHSLDFAPNPVTHWSAGSDGGFTVSDQFVEAIVASARTESRVFTTGATLP